MKSGVLLTSDVSARGVDYPNVTHVIQIGLPDTADQYVHRVGRIPDKLRGVDQDERGTMTEDNEDILQPVVDAGDSDVLEHWSQGKTAFLSRLAGWNNQKPE